MSDNTKNDSSEETIAGMTREQMVTEMVRIAKILDIGDDKGFNPGSFRVMIDLFNKDLSYLVVLRQWFHQHKDQEEWKDFFERCSTGWLWSLYKDKNGENLEKLCAFIRDGAQTA